GSDPWPTLGRGYGPGDREGSGKGIGRLSEAARLTAFLGGFLVFCRALGPPAIGCAIGALPLRLLGTLRAVRFLERLSRSQHIDELPNRWRELAAALVDDRERPCERALLKLEQLQRVTRKLML